MTYEIFVSALLLSPVVKKALAFRVRPSHLFSSSAGESPAAVASSRTNLFPSDSVRLRPALAYAFSAYEQQFIPDVFFGLGGS